MSEPGNRRIQAAIVHMIGLILCAVALWALRRWRLPFLVGTVDGIMPLKSALYLLVFTPLLIWLLWRIFLIASAGRVGGLAGVFIMGVLFVGLGLGMHDTATLLGAAGNTGWSPRVVEARRFYDEILGHGAFWLGFVLTTVATGVAQISNPMPARQPWLICMVFGLLGLPLATVMLGNLMFEHTGRDLVVIGVALSCVLAVHAWKRVELRRLPLLCLLYPAYALALIGTLLYWAVQRGES